MEGKDTAASVGSSSRTGVVHPKDLRPASCMRAHIHRLDIPCSCAHGAVLQSAPLQVLRTLCAQDGPPLSMGEQLHRLQELQILHVVLLLRDYDFLLCSNHALHGESPFLLLLPLLLSLMVVLSLCLSVWIC
jgi:hypothetical protein